MSTTQISGSQTARIEVIPDGDEHPRWQEIVDLLDSLGIKLDPWQLRILWASLLRRGEIWACFTVGVCAPRQNGKNSILEAREIIAPLVLREKLLIHSAHLADTSKEAFRRLEDVIDANDSLSKDVRHIWRTNGHEAIEFRDGHRIRYRTRTRGGGRGFSGSPVIFDEAMYLPEISYGAMLPVISAQPDPQTWLTGSAVDQSIMEDGVVFTRAREQAMSGQDRIAWFEWSLDAVAPGDVTAEQAESEETWAETNPAFGIRISADYLRSELRSLDSRTFAVERLGVGDWPRTDGLNTVIDLALWAGLADADSKITSPICVAFDVRPDRLSANVAIVGHRADGHLHVELDSERSDGTGWVVPRIVELMKHRPVAVVCDGVGPAATLVAELEQSSVFVQQLTTAEVGRACGIFFDLVQQGRLHHLDDPTLLAAIKGAAQRPLGDAWAWSRKNSSTDISALVAVTLGVWAAVTRERNHPFATAW